MLILNPSVTQYLVECLGESQYFASTLLSLSTKPMTLKKDNYFVQNRPPPPLPQNCSNIALDTEIYVKALRKWKDNLDPIAVGQWFAVLWFPGLSFGWILPQQDFANFPIKPLYFYR